MKLYYLPLEAYEERYTSLMSRVDGWTETWFKRYGVDFVRIEGHQSSIRIIIGSVLDAYTRSLYAMDQISKVVKKLQRGEIKDGDIIFAEDFWHPGIEALFYIRQLSGIKFKVGCFCWAQSIDDSDFTYPMRDWMRPMEIGMSKGYDYVFTCSDILKGLAIEAGYDQNHIHKTGLPYNSRRLKEQLAGMGFYPREKKPFVLFSSRFDEEKNPMFFLDLVERCPDIKFKLVKPRIHLSNSDKVTARAESVRRRCNNFEIVDTSEKLDYYHLLSAASVQFNCAHQDWVSWTLLEAITFQCQPLYPNHKDFPFELKGYEEDHIYEKGNLNEAERKLRKLLTKPFDPSLHTIVDRHNLAWYKKLVIMGVV